MKALQYYILCKFFSKTQMRYMSQFTRRTQNFHSNNGIRSATGLITSEYVSFIHSFITEIYIAPLQGYYSEALPTLARLRRRVLRLEQNVSERILGSNLWDKGSST